MLHEYVDPFMQAHGTAFLIVYLLIGFVGGFFIVKDGQSEDPITTWLFATVAGPLIFAVFILIALPFLPFYFLVKLLGIEASEGDTHGV